MADTSQVRPFFSWFSQLEDSVEHGEEEQYRPYLESLRAYQTQCDTVLEEVTQCVDFLRQLHQQYINVSTKTNALHGECEHLLAEQNGTNALHECEHLLAEQNGTL
nr:hypothetical protein BaRGS_019780 [Batillaria attramentaria]